MMNDKDIEISDGLNQIFEIINAKGDVGELKEIVNEKKNSDDEEKKNESSFTMPEYL
ncbi:hypothetical protein [Neobacillus sp. D3-1R]|uniref:hypothetical protein n=1 Tax=Neobacillus sp. D3-1R TaxID=3445778 RepID=UPI003FA08968